ncbi:hypothetical protein PPYR_04913 [Photinus pyralis]|uniref:NADH dehydrogenase [ubiquinone] 1 beta subcomplex subunit 5, mitochondrial n=1 Tax=Photinus pyralis TaxID=7054 RepID=A0A1Y1N332_PHOPY|nr:NADH dehydrogenase [ubiquinone] 1 beta subcomplex subunit 5, mitochondrial [Photinus pyralis]KAB0802727.1 hypothetical protein PPYR_04913 [Photinus pyralis]
MVILSTLRPILLQQIRTSNAVNRCMSDHRVFPYQPSRWQWNKFKDYAHFYILLGVIPLTLITVGANIFIGPATLSEIPEGYEPKHWEYHRSPISRFMAKYILTNPQQDYEKFLHHLYEENEKRILRKLEKEVKEKMKERNDYQAYYYQPVMAKYHRISRETADKLEEIRGS